MEVRRGASAIPTTPATVETLEEIQGEVSAAHAALDNERGKSRKFLTEEGQAAEN